MYKKIIVVSGTRADYGILKPLLYKLNEDKKIELGLIITGMHLSPIYGNTIEEIKKDPFDILGTVDILLQNSSHANMAKSIGLGILGFTDILSRELPEMIVVLGDRGEMLAAAIAAAHLNIVVVHIHGGEVSGSIDESVRHAISKLSHIHFTATQKSRERLIKMGEYEENVFCVGAPRIDTILSYPFNNLNKVNKKYKLNLVEYEYYLFVYHPVSTEFSSSENELDHVLKYLSELNEKLLIIAPNSDAGSDKIRNLYRRFGNDEFIIITNFDSISYLNVLKYCKAIIGNSSSGIIEAASYKVPTINIGNRQKGRERSNNIIDISLNVKELDGAINKLKELNRDNIYNIYGQGNSSIQIVNILKKLEINNGLIEKRITY